MKAGGWALLWRLNYVLNINNEIFKNLFKVDIPTYPPHSQWGKIWIFIMSTILLWSTKNFKKIIGTVVRITTYDRHCIQLLSCLSSKRENNYYFNTFQFWIMHMTKFFYISTYTCLNMQSLWFILNNLIFCPTVSLTA